MTTSSRVHRASLTSPPVRVSSDSTVFIAADSRKSAVAQLSLSAGEGEERGRSQAQLVIVLSEQSDDNNTDKANDSVRTASVLEAAWLAIDGALQVVRRFTITSVVGMDEVLVDRLGGRIQDVAKNVQLHVLGQGPQSSGLAAAAAMTTGLPFFLPGKPYEETETKLGSGTVVRHPVRPSKPFTPSRKTSQNGSGGNDGVTVGTLYSRYISSLDQFFCLDPLSSDQHLTLLHRWLNDPRVDAFWQDAGSLEDHERFVKGRVEDRHTLAVVGSYVNAARPQGEGEDVGPSVAQPEPATCKFARRI
jgi:hypothetical protein